VRVKALAFNPVDYIMRDYLVNVNHFPSVFGTDISGVVEAVGSDLQDKEPSWEKGLRVLAFAPSFEMKGDPDYGGMQEFVIVPSCNVTPIPDSLSFTDAGNFQPIPTSMVFN
jgi:NADPH:quinone reductase-like Zn-dependent oxidoreductase